MQKNVLIIGGTSGLGKELAIKHIALGNVVHVTGRKSSDILGASFHKLSITDNFHAFIPQIDSLIKDIGTQVDILIYCAGFYQEGHIDELSENDILTMINTGMVVPSILIKKIKEAQKSIEELIFITSSSAYTPREKEPIYTATKAAMHMLGQSLSLDQHIKKVRIFAPSGMKTPFWSGEKDTNGYLEPQWVAEIIHTYSESPSEFLNIRILRNPSRVEITEER